MSSVLANSELVSLAQSGTSATASVWLDEVADAAGGPEPENDVSALDGLDKEHHTVAKLKTHRGGRKKGKATWISSRNHSSTKCIPNGKP